MVPGEVITRSGDVVLNDGSQAMSLEVANSGDRPIQVGSHYHFAETNPARSCCRGSNNAEPRLSC